MAGVVQNQASAVKRISMKNRAKIALVNGCVLAYCICFSATSVHAAAIPTIQANLKTPSSTVKIEQKASPFEPIFPELNVQIPGLKFGDITLDPSQKANVPYLAQYISAIYKYLVGASIIAAAIMITYGGFLYITGSSGLKIGEGKEYIQDALIGLFLVLAANTILYTITGKAENQLQPLKVQIVRKEVFSYMAGNQDAPGTLTEVGIQPRSKPAENVAPDNARTCDPGSIDADASDSEAAAAKGNCTQAGTPQPKPADADKEYIPPPSTAKFPTDLTIPKECPGRDPSVDQGMAMLGKTPLYPSNRLALNDKKTGTVLDEKVINAYLAEQSRTGVPAGTLLGQMLTETWNKCVLLRLFDKSITQCGGGDEAKYFNFGGIGCTANQVPADICPHVAFGKYFIIGKQKELASVGPDDDLGPNTRWNKFISGRESVCMDAARSSTRETYTNCGPKCYPQPSHASTRINGDEYWYQSVQCSRKYNNAEEFLASHLGFVRYCMPYNDSVYKFAYCIGASTYAGVTGDKGPLIAAIIERNCLCGSRDSSGCKRDLELEQKLKNGVIKKRNLFVEGRTCDKRDPNTNKCLQFGKPGEIDYAGIISSLKGAGIDPRQAPGDVSGVLYSQLNP